MQLFASSLVINTVQNPPKVNLRFSSFFFYAIYTYLVIIHYNYQAIA